MTPALIRLIRSLLWRLECYLDSRYCQHCHERVTRLPDGTRECPTLERRMAA